MKFNIVEEVLKRSVVKNGVRLLEKDSIKEILEILSKGNKK